MVLQEWFAGDATGFETPSSIRGRFDVVQLEARRSLGCQGPKLGTYASNSAVHAFGGSIKERVSHATERFTSSFATT